MNRSLLTTVLRHAGASADHDSTPDGELLRRFAADRNEAAFAELVHRHGPMVWAACRHLLPNGADAEDAFQATFLALVRSAGTVREGPAVGGWLHRVAVRAATKVRRAAVRRKQRERRAAGEEADCPVPDTAWDTLFAAVHEEIEHLPAALRAAFVLCDLEGVRQPDAAARLGWKLGTLSGRLTRARQQLLDRLNRRGLAPAVVAGGVGLSAAVAAAPVPRGLVEQVVSFAGAAGALPGAVAPSILELAKEIVPMTLNRTKLIAAAALMAAGLATGAGAIFLPAADAQPPGGERPPAPRPPATAAAPAIPPVPPAPGAPPSGPPRGNDPAMGGMSRGGMGMGGQPGMMPMTFAFAQSAHTKWEYKFIAGGFPAKDFVQLFTDLGNDGWEFCGYGELAANQLADAVRAHADKIVVRPGSPTTLIFKRSVRSAPSPVTVMTAPPMPGGMSPPGAGMPGMGGMPGIMGMMGGMGGTPPGAAGVMRETGAAVYGTAGTQPRPKSLAEKQPAGGFQIVALKHAEAQQLVLTLSELFGGGGAGGGGAGGGALGAPGGAGGGGRLQIVADKRTNSLILRGDAETLREAEELIKKLDVPAGAPSPRSSRECPNRSAEAMRMIETCGTIGSSRWIILGTSLVTAAG